MFYHISITIIIFFSRHSPKALPIFPNCGHNTKAFQCSTLTMKELKTFHEAFYAIHQKDKQDAILIKYCDNKVTKRRRPKNGVNQGKDFQIKCFVPRLRGEVVPVCQKAFLGILGLKKGRLQFVLKKFFSTGKSPHDERGGDRKSVKNVGKRQAITNFILKLKCTESHYCRSRSTRQYLPSELSVNKLFSMYNSQANDNLKVKSWLFRSVFNTKFNVGFKRARTDMCSTCLQLNEQIQRASNKNEKSELLIKKRVHNLRAKAFYNYLSDNNEEILILSFDCQKNQVLPKLPDQSTYYSRQLYLFNFTIVVGHSHSKLTPTNVFSYCCTENLFHKDSNLIASLVFDRLNKIDLSKFKIVRLMSDGCGGQNKNSILITMLMYWLEKAPNNIEQVQMIFPVVGHSFIPPDRVFGASEKVIKKQQTIVDPNEYLKIFSSVATVINIEKQCKIFDWKSESRNFIKPPGKWNFRFSYCKRFILQRSKKNKHNVLVKGEENYRTDINKFSNVCQTHKSISMINPIEIKPGESVGLKPLKIRDVNRLLSKHYGENWMSNEALKELDFYKNIISPVNVENEDPADYEECSEPFCQPRDEADELII